MGLLTRPWKQKAEAALGIRTDSFGVRLYRAAATFVLVDFAWLFFRANTVQDAFLLIGNMFRFDPLAFVNGSVFGLGLPVPEFCAALVGIAVVLAADLLSRGRDPRDRLLARNTAVRWTAYVAGALMILTFGEYGSGAGAQQFIYFNF